MLSTNKIARFFDHHYLWKESINIFDFLHADEQQGKIGSEITTFARVWPVAPLVQSDFWTL